MEAIVAIMLGLAVLCLVGISDGIKELNRTMSQINTKLEWINEALRKK